MAKVFVSYRRRDLPQVERLASEIRAAGHNVWFDEWEISLGDSVVQKIGEGLAGAAYLVLCCSPAGTDSGWMGREWMSALARQLNGAGIYILPVLLSGGTPPAILADLRYADLSRDWHLGVRELLSAIR
jgi:hypothetical protein